MSKKLLLINPWQTYPKYLQSEYQSFFPYGLACLGAIGIESGFETKIVDCLEDETMIEIGDKVKFGKTKEELKAIIDDFKPDVVGVSSLFSMFANDAIEVAQTVKECNPQTTVILGGVTATIEDIYKPLLDLEVFDIMSRGEGERTIQELLNNYNEQIGKIENLGEIKGIAYKDATGEVVITPQREFECNLDSLPKPAFHLLNMDKMLSNRYYSRWRNNPKDKRTMPMFTSRGCPYNCTFCSVHSQVGYRFRAYSVDYVVSLIKDCIEKYDINHFHFEDDNMTLNKARAKELFERLKQLNISWDTPNGVRADTLDEEMLNLMMSSGLTSISIAAESGNEKVRMEVIHKNLTDDSILNAVQLCNKLDIPCIVFFVLGFPGETLADIKDSINFAKRIAKEYKTINMVYVANPLPGTQLSKEATDKGYIKKELDCTDYFEAVRINKNSIIETEEFNKRKIFELLKQELDLQEFSVHNPSIPMFWSNDELAHARAKRAFPRSSNRPYVWQWRDEENEK